MKNLFCDKQLLKKTAKYLTWFFIAALLGWVVYGLIPKYKTGYAADFKAFKERYPNRKMIDLDTEGELFYIEYQLPPRASLMVLGYLTPDGFSKLQSLNDERFRIGALSSTSFFYIIGRERIPEMVWKKMNIGELQPDKEHFRYDFLDSHGKRVPRTIWLESTHYSITMYIEPDTRRFVLRFPLYP